MLKVRHMFLMIYGAFTVAMLLLRAVVVRLLNVLMLLVEKLSKRILEIRGLTLFLERFRKRSNSYNSKSPISNEAVAHEKNAQRHRQLSCHGMNTQI
jgi:hypothetical protein